MPPSRKIKQETRSRTASGCGSCTRPFHIVAIQAEELDAARNRDDEADRGEERQSRATGTPVANMWCTHTPKLMKPIATSDADDPRRSRRVAAREHRDDHRDHAGGRNEEDVHLGVAPEPEQVLVEQRAPAGGGPSRTACRNRRSSSSSAAASVTAGTANSTMNEKTSIDHTKQRHAVQRSCPGARHLKVVTMKFTAPTVVEMPTKMTPRPQKSMS